MTPVAQTLFHDYEAVGGIYRFGRGWAAYIDDGKPTPAPSFSKAEEARAWVERWGMLPLCPACIGSIGGAHGGPDAPYRRVLPVEPCGAADCQGAPLRCPDSGLTIEEESWGPEGDSDEGEDA